jgi:pyruvate dehydrogenase E2 component (dihydrolipoamide acetyltransferase)
VPPIAPAPNSAALKGETQVVEPDRAARAIARRSAEIRATVPDLELARDVDAGPALALSAERGHSLTALLVHACATALRELPYGNAAYRDGRYELYSRINVGVTVQAGEVQLIPTVLDADVKMPAQLTEEITRLTERARGGELTPPEQAGATFTLSDLTRLDADRLSALVISPQAAALTAGRVREAPVVRDGAVVPGHVIGLTLGCDHRILYGERASALLARIAGRLEQPEP